MGCKKDSKKYLDFVKELRRLCLTHEVCISTSGYDCIQVHDIGDDLQTIHQNNIVDMTNEDKNG